MKKRKLNSKTQEAFLLKVYYGGKKLTAELKNLRNFSLKYENLKYLSWLKSNSQTEIKFL